ncbi:hypothetical protein G6F56_013257 [Rhizopus delemar]|nr:hypothetical protein G6F56_013257 [Rhizopus delemar]
MGNQASKVIEKSKEKKEKRKNNRRRSTVTLGRSSMKQGVISGNYDWIDERQEPKSRRQSITEFFVGRKKSLAQEDLREQDRLQRMHYLLKSARKTNTACTLSESMTILDIGTGNGIWALEIATEQPKSTVIGLDIRPPAEPQGKPKNLTFMEADITKPWPLESNSIDL